MLYYKPDDGWAGDPVPFYWEGKFHLFYVKEIYRPPLLGWRHFWGHVVSDDLINWQECPDAIPIGEVGQVDSASCGTGSVFYDGEIFHIYYLGRYFNTKAEIRETICHATSPDLMNWTKDPDNPIYKPDPALLNLEACRDPFPLWNEDKGHYSMVFTAQLPDRPLRRSGCLASIKSKNLKNWEFEEIFFAPNIWDCLECPDIFKWGDWWYLIYSSTGITSYRRSRSLEGPWENPPVNELDGNQFYAAKTGFDGKRRILFGWVPSRKGERDDTGMEWGGSMAIREIIQDEQGYLWTKNPYQRNRIGRIIEDCIFSANWGNWHISKKNQKTEFKAVSPHSFSYAISSGLEDNYYLTGSFEGINNIKAFGLFFRASQDLEQGYLLRIEPISNRIRLFRMTKGIYNIIHDRYMDFGDEENCSFEVILKDCILDLYINNRISLVSRCYDYSEGELALFIDSGKGKFRNIEIRNIDNK